MIPRVRAFVGPRAEERAARVGHFFKAMAGQESSREWCIRHKIALTKATAENQNTIGGFLAPEDFDAAILVVREKVGAFRQGADVRPLNSMSNVRPRWFGGLTANFVQEGAAIPESSLLLDAVGANAKKLAILARVSSELFEDAAPDLGEFITSEIGYAFAATEDDCGFNGDGTSTYSGISGLATKLVGNVGAVTAAAGHNTFALLDSIDLAALMGAVMGAAIPGARWYVSALGYAQCFERLASYPITTRLPDGTLEASYLGFPVSFSAKLPNVATSLSGKPMMFFGNLAMSSVIAERSSQMVLSMANERYLDTDQVAIRGIQREDIINHSVGSASTAGPVAMLLGG